MEKKATKYIETPISFFERERKEDKSKHSSSFAEYLDFTFFISGEIEIEDKLAEIYQRWKFHEKTE